MWSLILQELATRNDDNGGTKNSTRIQPLATAMMAATSRSNNQASDDVFDSFTDSKPSEDQAVNQEDFDPFQVGATNNDKSSSAASAVSGKGSTALPPKMIVKFKLHEEVSSTSLIDSENEGSSEVMVLGTVLVSQPFIGNGIAEEYATMNDEMDSTTVRAIRKSLTVFVLFRLKLRRQTLSRMHHGFSLGKALVGRQLTSHRMIPSQNRMQQRAKQRK